MNCNKTQYTKIEAQTALNRLINKGKWSHKKTGRKYQCPHCEWWHLTHREEENGSGKLREVKLKFENKFKEFLK